MGARHKRECPLAVGGRMDESSRLSGVGTIRGASNGLPGMKACHPRPCRSNILPGRLAAACQSAWSPCVEVLV
jgi:hypothetical protein